MSLFALGLIVVGSMLLAGALGALARRHVWEARRPILAPEDGDRREDVDSRERITVLEERWRRTAQHLFAAVTVLGAGLTTAMAILYVLFGQLHDSRVRALREQCEHNKSSVATASAKFPELTPFFLKVFPYKDDCQADAERRASQR